MDQEASMKALRSMARVMEDTKQARDPKMNGEVMPESTSPDLEFTGGS